MLYKIYEKSIYNILNSSYLNYQMKLKSASFHKPYSEWFSDSLTKNLNSPFSTFLSIFILTKILYFLPYLPYIIGFGKRTELHIFLASEKYLKWNETSTIKWKRLLLFFKPFLKIWLIFFSFSFQFLLTP